PHTLQREIVEGRVHVTVQVQVRIDAARIAYARNERGIGKQRLFAESKQCFVHRLGVRRKHSRSGPRRGARGLVAIVHAHDGAALGKFERDRQTDQTGADDGDVARIAHVRLSLFACLGSPNSAMNGAYSRITSRTPSRVFALASKPSRMRRSRSIAAMNDT